MKLYLKTPELKIGDTVSTSTGYAYTITDIETINPQNGSPEYLLTVYSNINDDHNLHKKELSFNETVLVIARNFEYKPKQFKLY